MRKEKPLNYQQHILAKVYYLLLNFFLSCVEVVVEFGVVAIII